MAVDTSVAWDETRHWDFYGFPWMTHVLSRLRLLIKTPKWNPNPDILTIFYHCWSLGTLLEFTLPLKERMSAQL